MSPMSQMRRLPTCFHGTQSVLYVPQLLLGLHKSTCIQTLLNWTGVYTVTKYLWMAWIMQLALQRTQYQILFYDKKLRKFSSGKMVQRFQPCFGWADFFHRHLGRPCRKENLLKHPSTQCFPVTETVKYIRFLPQNRCLLLSEHHRKHPIWQCQRNRDLWVKDALGLYRLRQITLQCSGCSFPWEPSKWSLLAIPSAKAAAVWV